MQGPSRASIPGLARPVFFIAMLKVGAHVATSARYGYHRDELYFLEAAQHLGWGFVDFPPVTAFITFLIRHSLGDSLLALRILPAIAGAALVIFAGLIARELGGGPSAQILAALAILVAPVLLASNGLLGTVTFDQLTWTIGAFILVRLLRTGRAHLWVWFGIAAGVGLLTKYTIAAFLAGVGIGFLTTPGRSWLRTPWPYLALGIAGIIVLPNLLWQQSHAWPTLEFLRHQETSATAETSVWSFLLNQLLFPGPLAVPLLVAGLWHIFVHPRFRPLAWAATVVVLVFAATGGKAYYTSPLYPLLFAAGGVVIERLTAPARKTWLRPAVAVAVVLGVLVPLPAVLPVLPAQAMIVRGLHEERPDYADMFGWEELAATVARVYQELPAEQRSRASILTLNYGEAGAVDFFGPALGLPEALSGHNSYWLWQPAAAGSEWVIAVGFQDEMLRNLSFECRRVAVLSNQQGVRNEEWGRPIHVCRTDLPLDTKWPALKRFTA